MIAAMEIIYTQFIYTQFGDDSGNEYDNDSEKHSFSKSNVQFYKYIICK